MPTVQWGISPQDVDDFDRSTQFTPYRGKIPPNAVYDWAIKLLKYQAGTRTKNPALWVGLELVPRDKSEEKYAGYFIMDFIPVMDKTVWRYAPLLDALEISGNDFARKTRYDTDGNITRIGRWALNGDMVSAQLADGVDKEGNPRKEIKGGAYYPCLEVDADEDDEELTDDEYEEDEDYADGDEEDDGF